MTEALAWVWINEHTRRNRLNALRLIEELGSAGSVLQSDLDVLSKRLGLAAAKKFVGDRKKTDFAVYEEILRKHLKEDIQLVTILDESYPALLKHVDDPPMSLFTKGSLKDFSNCVAVVGARNISSRGYRSARDCARNLAKRGYVVVSGLARGTDTQAHIGALEAEGRTVAVLATSLDRIYPPENEKIAEEIALSGALLSEMAMHRRTDRSDFVLRNRITSGMSLCLVIIESSGRGGTSAQIEYAISQGKRVLVLTQDESDADHRRGFVDFINRGAEPFRDPEELISLVDVIAEEAKQRSQSENHGPLDKYITH